MNHSTDSKKKQPRNPTEGRTIRYWTATMVNRLDQPIGFRPCPVGAQYPNAKRTA